MQRPAPCRCATTPATSTIGRTSRGTDKIAPNRPDRRGALRLPFRTGRPPGCDNLVAAMVGLSTRALHERGDVRSLFTYLDDEPDWQAGEHVSICYAMVSTTHMVRATLKGLGSRPLPVLRHVGRRFVARRH